MKKRIALSAIMAIMVIATVVITLVFGKTEQAKIIVATDTHYLSSAINDGGVTFTDMVNNADGKLVQYCNEIISAFSDDVIEQKPDVLILSGDLTFNGEKASHEDFVKKLRYIQDNGVQVLTIAGNHDIDIKNSVGFKNDEYYLVDSISADEFSNMYADFGMNQAVSVDEYSLSYLYEVNKDLYILMLDTNAYGRNFVQDNSYDWIREQLEYIKHNHAQVITVSHQNLFAHNEQLSFGYQLYDADELLALYNEYGVKCNLSGHIHMQHISTNGVCEIATSSLLVAPVQYGVVEFDGKIKYHTATVNVEKWAKNNGVDDENLLKFRTYATDFFVNSGVQKSLTSVADSELNDDEKAIVAKTFAKLNSSYFAGTKISGSIPQSDIDLCKKSGNFMSNYFDTMLTEAQNDYTYIEIK